MSGVIARRTSGAYEVSRRADSTVGHSTELESRTSPFGVERARSIVSRCRGFRPITCPTRGPDCSKVWRYFGSRPRSHACGCRTCRVHQAPRQRRCCRRQRDGQDHRQPHFVGHAGLQYPLRPRDGHAAHHGRAHVRGIGLYGHQRPWHRRSQLHRQPGRHHHRQQARQGQDHRGQGRPCPRGLGPGQGVRCCWFPRCEQRERNHHTWSWRQRSHRLGTCAGTQRRCLRDLHRCHRRVHRRPAHRSASSQVGSRQLR